MPPPPPPVASAKKSKKIAVEAKHLSIDVPPNFQNKSKDVLSYNLKKKKLLTEPSPRKPPKERTPRGGSSDVPPNFQNTSKDVLSYDLKKKKLLTEPDAPRKHWKDRGGFAPAPASATTSSKTPGNKASMLATTTSRSNYNWSDEEDKKLRRAIVKFCGQDITQSDWYRVAEIVGTRSFHSCYARGRRILEVRQAK